MKPTLIDYVQDRHGKVIYRTDNRCAVMAIATRADWDGRPMPRPPVPDPAAARSDGRLQMVHIMEGVVQRGTATVLRDLNRPLFGKTGTTIGPTNVWFVGGTPDIVAGVYHGLRPAAADGRLCAGRPHRRADLQAVRADRASRTAQGAVRRAAGHPHGPDRRRAGKRVYGIFPTQDDPKAAVIWEAFKPETEPRRTLPPRATAIPMTAQRSRQRRVQPAATAILQSAAAASAGPAALARRIPAPQPAIACQRRTAL